MSDDDISDGVSSEESSNNSIERRLEEKSKINAAPNSNSAGATSATDISNEDDDYEQHWHEQMDAFEVPDAAIGSIGVLN